KGDEVMSPDEFQALPEKDRAALQTEIEQLQDELKKVLRQVPRWQREKQKRLRELDLEVSRVTIEPLISELRDEYAGHEDALGFIDAVAKDVAENADALVRGKRTDQQAAGESQPVESDVSPPLLRRYRVNVLVDQSQAVGAPVIYEDHPTFQNLIGRIEHIPRQGTLVTDFTLIKPGALQRANGGFLILDALRVLMQPLAWESLKRALKSQQVEIESLGQTMGLVSTFSLEPEPMPLSVKLILVGHPMLYHLLSAYDPDLRKLFKVAADFDEQVARDGSHQQLYARFIAKLVGDHSLRVFDKTAVARVIEHSARMQGDAERMSLQIDRIVDLMREADYWAEKDGREVVEARDVQQAIDESIYRSDRIRQRLHEEIQRGTILIDTDDAVVGQVNGLAVYMLASYAFGRPSRITARVRMGKGEIIDIEREVKLSGPLHSKGVLILSGFLSQRYAADRPLSLSASLVFEQSYGGVDGDSASLAELCALLSAIANVPIRQSLAMTGSVNQRGEVQAIGGVNEKIEGMFDVCRARGLTGEQGVLIPASNVKHLMLRHDVVDAVRAGQFHVYAVETVDQAIALLTGMAAGEADETGKYPERTFNRLVDERLGQLASRWKEFTVPAKSEESP
ncbi:MAG: AAA family ATPase, partial [Acidobacteriota bacterium]